MGFVTVFRADAECTVEDRTVGAVVKGQLDDARPVAQVDEDQGAQVPLSLTPSGDGDFPADVRGGESAAVIGPLVRFGE